MKIGIHHHPGSFSDRWIEYCEKNKILYKKVDCYQNNIIDQLSDCDGLMWHWHHADYKAVLFARQLIFSLERMGKQVFPNSATCWHFDDKVGQKYLLESIGAPMVASYVFYDKEEALKWVDQVSFPKVFKLRGGAGSSNVQLVRSKSKAIAIVNRAFGKGFSAINHIELLKDRIRQFKKQKNKKNILNLFKTIFRLVVPTRFEKMHGREKGYVYFQDYIEDNIYDTRVIVIGSKVFALRRYNREGDFRASGSGALGFSKELFDLNLIKVSFEISQKLNAQCVAYDFVFNKTKPEIIEISYGFAVNAYDACEGYWDNQMTWHEGNFNPQQFMIEDFIESINNRFKKTI